MSTAPMKARDLAEHKKNLKAETARNTVGLVWADGRVTTHVCSPPGEGEDDGVKTGDTPIRWINGAPGVWKPYADRGCVLLEEMCKADKRLDIYEQWHAVITAQITRPGIPVRGDVEDLYPPSVLARRGSHRAGGLADGMAFVIGKGIAPDPKLDVDKLAGRLADAGLPAPSADEKAAAEKKAAPKSPKEPQP